MCGTTQISIRDLRIDMVQVSSLKPYPGNARAHSAKQIDQIAGSIRQFGWTNPILIDASGGVIAGHGRLEAAKRLGLQDVPVVRISDLSEAQKRAYILADNKLAENANWDPDLLKIEVSDLLELELGFSVEDLGFETAEIDLIVGDGPDTHRPETVPSPRAGPPVSDVGDVWVLGRHRLICGDALQPQTYKALLRDDQVDAVFTDPPYNVPIKGHVGGLGAIQHAEFPMASGEMSDAAFRGFLANACARIAAVCKPGAVVFMCMDWRHIGDLLAAGEMVFGKPLNVCVWNKHIGGMGSLYRSKHELIAVLKAPGAPHCNNVQLGKHGRNRTNVWDYPGVQSRRDDLKHHPTVKPIAMVADAIQDVTKRSDLILDPFAGSGSTLLAAERTGRRAACAELDPHYVDLIIRRFEDETGEEAVLAGSGLPFRVLA